MSTWERRLAAASARSAAHTGDLDHLIPDWLSTDDHDALAGLIRLAATRSSFQCQLRVSGPTGWMVVTMTRHRDGVDVSVRPEVVDGHDQLTGLVGRGGFDDQMAAAMDRAERNDHLVAVLWIDLDHFRRINALYGRQIGDETICGLATALRDSLRPTDVLARFGSDEFVIVAPGVHSMRDARIVAERSRAIVESFRLPGRPEVETTASVGVVIGRPNDGPTDLITSAEVASIVAKVNGRNRTDVYDEAIRATVEQNQQADRSLRTALEADELTIAFEPIIEPASGSPALIRATATLAGSSDLTDPAATIALRHRIVGSIIASASGAVASTDDDDTLRPRLVVPLARDLLAETGLVDVIVRALAVGGLAPDRLVLEIDERILTEHRRVADETLHRLADMGVGLAIGGFSGGSLGRQRLDESRFDHVFLTPELQGELHHAATAALIADPVTAVIGSRRVCIIGGGVDDATALRDAVVAGCHLVRGRALDRTGSTAEILRARHPRPADTPRQPADAARPADTAPQLGADASEIVW